MIYLYCTVDNNVVLHFIMKFDHLNDAFREKSKKYANFGGELIQQFCILEKRVNGQHNEENHAIILERVFLHIRAIEI